MLIKYTKRHFLFAMVVSVLMSTLGMFVIAPYYGFPGVYFTTFCLLVAIANGYAFFKKKELTLVELELKQPMNDLDTEIRKLEKLKEDKLISEEEFQQLRTKVMEQHLK